MRQNRYLYFCQTYSGELVVAIFPGEEFGLKVLLHVICFWHFTTLLKSVQWILCNSLWIELAFKLHAPALVHFGSAPFENGRCLQRLVQTHPPFLFHSDLPNFNFPGPMLHSLTSLLHAFANHYLGKAPVKLLITSKRFTSHKFTWMSQSTYIPLIFGQIKLITIAGRDLICFQK